MSIVNMIYCEFAKLKNSYFYLVLLAIACFFPAFLCFGWLGQGEVITSWNRFVLQMEQLAFMFVHIPLFTMVAAYIFAREYSCHTAQTLFCYPAARTVIFAVKLVTAIIVATLTSMLLLTLTFLGGLLLHHEPLTFDIVWSHLRMNLVALLYVYAILPVAVFVALLSRNVMIPMIYSGIITVTNIAIFETRGLRTEAALEYLPTLYPLEILFNSFVGGENEPSGIISVKSGIYLYGLSNWIALFTFVISLAICILHYSRADIDS